ncbi:MAG: XdhC family protein [Treponema sp.]|nr:XdhC family protein [Treponema sp.]MCL2129461.1 XdhC family protein [Treponema sp.]
MKELFTLISECLFSNEPLVLATIIKSSGSTPRGSGARMLAGLGSGGKGNRLWGTIGGGIAEHLAIKEAASLLKAKGTNHGPFFSVKKYVLNAEAAADLGACCGGEITVFFRTIDAGEPGLPTIIQKGITSFSGDKTVWFFMEINESDKKRGGNLSLGILEEGGLMACAGEKPGNPQKLLKSAAALIEDGEKLWFSEPLFQGGFVYIFGGGHIARELAPILARLGFRFIIFDDRKEFSNAELFPGAAKVIHGNFKQIGKSLRLKERDFVVIITRGHLWDMEALSFSLESPAAYIGIIGSKTKHALVKQMLLERGFSPELISAPRIHAPIGIKIESETPEEIAISIAAELILCRAKLRETK